VNDRVTRSRLLAGAGATFILAACGASKETADSGESPDGLIGQLVPDFRVPRLDGGYGSLADYRGKAVLANLWATWCPPCRHEMPALERLYKRYAARGFVVVGLDQGENPGIAKKFIERVGVTYPILFDSDQQYGPAFRAVGLPTSVFIRRDGIIFAAHDGELSYAQMAAQTTRLLSAR